MRHSHRHHKQLKIVRAVTSPCSIKEARWHTIHMAVDTLAFNFAHSLGLTALVVIGSVALIGTVLIRAKFGKMF